MLSRAKTKKLTKTHNFIHQNLVAQTQNSLNQEIKTNTNDIQITHNITMQQVLFRQRRQTGHIDQHPFLSKTNLCKNLLFLCFTILLTAKHPNTSMHSYTVSLHFVSKIFIKQPLTANCRESMCDFLSGQTSTPKRKYKQLESLTRHAYAVTVPACYSTMILKCDPLSQNSTHSSLSHNISLVCVR